MSRIPRAIHLRRFRNRCSAQRRSGASSFGTSFTFNERDKPVVIFVQTSSFPIPALVAHLHCVNAVLAFIDVHNVFPREFWASVADFFVKPEVPSAFPAERPQAFLAMQTTLVAPYFGCQSHDLTAIHILTHSPSFFVASVTVAARNVVREPVHAPSFPAFSFRVE
jgi:hypothetical protein